MTPESHDLRQALFDFAKVFLDVASSRREYPYFAQFVDDWRLDERRSDFEATLFRVIEERMPEPDRSRLRLLLSTVRESEVGVEQFSEVATMLLSLATLFLRWRHTIEPRAEEATTRRENLGREMGVVQELKHRSFNLFHFIQGQLRSLDEAEKRDRYSESWWERRIRELRQEFERNPSEGLISWFRQAVDLILTWQLRWCEWFLHQNLPLLAKGGSWWEQFGLATNLLEAPVKALPLIESLVEGYQFSSTRSFLTRSQRAQLLILKARIHLRQAIGAELDSRKAFLDTAQRSIDQAHAEDSDEVRIEAVEGDLQLLTGDLRKAEDRYRSSLERSSSIPDGRLGLGLVAEAEGRWELASDHYEDAAAAMLDRVEVKDPVEEFAALLAPVSGNAYLELARLLQENGRLDDAVRAVDKALHLGLHHEGKFPERLGHRLKGEILLAQKDEPGAAQQLYQAALGFAKRGDASVAVEILRQVCRLDPDHVEAAWILADELRRLSWQPERARVHADLIKESQRAWEEGTVRRLPGRDESWAYTARALLNQQKALLPSEDEITLWWEASVYLERALLHRLDDPYCWTYLARFHRRLHHDATALQATAQGLEHAPRHGPLLGERAATLADTGAWREALNIIDEYGPGDADLWLLSVKANCLAGLEDYENAIATINRTLNPTNAADPFFLGQRAAYARLAGAGMQARQDYAEVWKRRREPLFESQKEFQMLFAVAAYHLEKIEGAIALLEELANDPVQGPTARFYLAICLLHQNALPQAEASFEKGILGISNAAELEHLERTELVPLLDVLPGVKSWIDHIRLKRTQLPLPTAERELTLILEELKKDEVLGAWARLSAHAALGRICWVEKRWAAAREHYQRLRESGSRLSEGFRPLPMFPESEATLAVQGLGEDSNPPSHSDLQRE
jgi:tetratricopeptide (TPR) repeat protein